MCEKLLVIVSLSLVHARLGALHIGPVTAKSDGWPIDVQHALARPGSLNTGIAAYPRYSRAYTTQHGAPRLVRCTIECLRLGRKLGQIIITHGAHIGRSRGDARLASVQGRVIGASDLQCLRQRERCGGLAPASQRQPN
jgi:hypothetical protein